MEVTFPAAQLAAGYLPPVCPRHGVPATHRVRRRFVSKTPTSVLILVLLLIVVSFLIALLVALVFRRSVKATLPACESCRRDRQRAVTSVRAAWGLAVLVGAVGVLAGSAAAGLFCLVLGAGALVWSFASRSLYQMPGFVADNGMHVTLRRAHPVFVRALHGPVGPPPPRAAPIGAPGYFQAGPARSTWPAGGQLPWPEPRQG